MLIAARNAILAGGAKGTPYIETDGLEWFDSGLTGNGGLRVVVDFTYTALPTESATGTVFGWVTSDGDRLFLNHATESGGSFQYAWAKGAEHTAFERVGSNIIVGRRMLVDANYTSGKLKFILDGSVLYTSSRTFSHSNYLRIIVNRLAYNGSGNVNGLYATGCGHIRYYSLKFYNGSDVLLRDFEPVQVNGVAYFHDKVNDVLYANQGGGAFVYGLDASAANGGGISANA